MFKQTKRILIAGLPFFSPDNQNDRFTVTEEKMQERLKQFEALCPASGWDRVKFGLFHKNEYGDRSPYIANIMQTTFVSGVAGFVYGGYKKSQTAYMEFMRTNQSTAYLTPHEAKKALQDRIFLTIMRGGVQLGWRTALFGFMFLTVSNCIALYRNKEGILEYAMGGAIAGSTYRTHIGIRGMIVGGILGFTFGSVGGGFHYLMYKLTGYSATDIKNAQYAFSVQQNSALLRADQIGWNIINKDHTELKQAMVRDEKTGRIEDDLNQIERINRGLEVQNQPETKLEAAPETKSEAAPETKSEAAP